MTMAEFEEKQYEAAANVALAWGNRFPAVFPSGQVLEELLGYDTAAAPDPAHSIWRVLAVPRPKGVRLLPSFWPKTASPPGHRLPSTPVSLVLQFKRPEYLRGAQAMQWSLWRQPYFRFRRTEQQHRVLKRLERRVRGAAVVRYAAPAFWRYEELESHQLAGTILDASGFVSPLALGSHKVWTYAHPGTMGYPNPNGAGVPFQRFEELLLTDLFRDVEASTAQQGAVVVREGLAMHLREMADAVSFRDPQARQPVARWMTSVVQANLDLDPTRLQSLHDYALVQSTLRRIGACWFIA